MSYFRVHSAAARVDDAVEARTLRYERESSRAMMREIGARRDFLARVERLHRLPRAGEAATGVI